MRRAGRGTFAGGASIGQASDGRLGRAAPSSQRRSGGSRGTASSNQARHARLERVAPLTPDRGASTTADVEVVKLHLGIVKLHVGIVAMQRAPSVRRR